MLKSEKPAAPSPARRAFSFLNKETNMYTLPKSIEDLYKRPAADRAETNRQNATHSTGPKTPEGKAASSKNRLAHGLCSSALLLVGEDEAELDLLRKEIHTAYQPATDEERILTDQLVDASWRLNRARRIETEVQQRVMIETMLFLRRHRGDKVDMSPNALLAKSFLRDESEGPLRRMHRYVTTIERSHQRAVKALLEAIKRRPAVVVAAPVVEVPVVEVPKVRAAAASSPLPEIGFEPQYMPTTPAQTPQFHNRP
jgi:hypothetical protein